MSAHLAEVAEIPERTALYRVYGDGDELLYIGVSKSFGGRWMRHANSQPWWPEVKRQAVEWFDSRPEAEEAEEAAIQAEKPKYNKKHADNGNWGRPAAAERSAAQTMRELRVRAGLSQVKLADRMTEKNWPWRQQTVARIEGNRQPLRVGELVDVASILGVTPASMLSGDGCEAAADAREVMERALREQIATEILAGGKCQA